MLNPYARIDIPRLLERLSIQFRSVGGGRKLTSSCPNPLHPDKQASWFIRDIPGEPYHGAHVCQGCGFKGGPIILASTVLGLSEDDARAWLADLTAPPPMPIRVEAEVRESKIQSKFKLPECFKFAHVDDWPAKHWEYLAKRVEPWQVAKWGLGYIEKCSCIVNGKKTSRHAKRIAIPVANEYGELCGYTTRAIGKAATKYVEPHSSENAKRALFGSNTWGSAKTLVLVEGPFDVFAVEAVLKEAGYTEDDVGVAALRGSSPHPVVLARISQFERVIILTDPDKAGNKARAAILASCARHTKAISLILPQKTDSSSLIETPEGRIYLRKRLVSTLSLD